MDEVTLNAKAVLRKAMELILSDHQQQYGGKSDQSGYLTSVLGYLVIIKCEVDVQVSAVAPCLISATTFRHTRTL